MTNFARYIIEADLEPSGIMDLLMTDYGDVDTIRAAGRFAGDTESSRHLVINAAPAVASGYITLSSFVQPDTITINGVAFTGVATPSGVTEFAIGASDAATATNAALVLEQSTNAVISGVIEAIAESNRIDIISEVPGNIGNAITIAISAHGSVTGARLTGGTEGTSLSIQHGIA